MSENKRIPYAKECPYQREHNNKLYCEPIDNLCLLCIKGNSKLFNDLETMRKNGNRKVEDFYYGNE